MYKATTTAAALVIGLLTVAACGSSAGQTTAATQATPTRRADAATTAASSASATTGRTSTPASAPDSTLTNASTGAVIASEPFTPTVQLVQWETTESIWRLHFLPAGTTCEDELSSVRPAVGADFDTGGQSKLPAVGVALTGVGIVFTPKDRPDIGAFTANAGVTIRFDRVDPTPGGHWTGQVSVNEVKENNDTYSFAETIDATVCKPGQL